MTNWPGFFDGQEQESLPNWQLASMKNRTDLLGPLAETRKLFPFGWYSMQNDALSLASLNKKALPNWLTIKRNSVFLTDMNKKAHPCGWYAKICSDFLVSMKASSLKLIWL